MIKALDRFPRWERHFTRDIDKIFKLMNAQPQSEIDKTKPIPLPAPPGPNLDSPRARGSRLQVKRCRGMHNQHGRRCQQAGL